MTFLNQALLFGAAAFAIPLILHILNRSRFRTIDWGAMHLLESVVRTNQKRFRLEQLILLLLRCAIPILLACCLAQPVLTGSRTLDRDAPVSVVILLDNSYSMETASEEGTRFQAAVQAATEMIEAMGRGSEVAVILTGGGPVRLFDQPVFDPQAVSGKLKQVRAGYGASDMRAALEAALDTLASMSHPRREMILISDFQPADWEDVSEQAAAAFRERVAGMEIEPAITFLPVGDPVPGNICVDSLDFSDRALGIDQQLNVRANLLNHGSRAVDNARVILRQDGAEAAISQVTLPANAATQVLFPCRFDQAGSHVLEVEVVTDDPLQIDNYYRAAVTVWDRIHVLIVDGDPSNRPLESESEFLSVALTPYTFGRLQLADLVETTTVPYSALKAAAFEDVQVVVLTNVPKLNDAQTELLSAYVRGGGALLLFAGNRIDVNWYNTRLFAAGTGLLPLRFGEARGRIDDVGQIAHIAAQHFDHRTLQFFNQPANGDLSRPEIRQWYRLETAAAGTRPQQLVLAHLDNGDPLIVEQSFGAGLVLQVATACDADWSDLPQRPVYVPLMQLLVTNLATQMVPPQNLETGQPAVMLFETDDAEQAVSVLTPEGHRRTVHATSSGRLASARYENTQRPGVYTMTLPTAKSVHFVAESARSESLPEVLNQEEVQAQALDFGAVVSSSSAEYREQDHLRRHGRAIWKLVLSTLLFAMFLELVLQQRFARVVT